jgi:hypothetical protein
MPAQAAKLRADLEESERDVGAERVANAALWEELQAAGYKRYDFAEGAEEVPDQAAVQPARAAAVRGHRASRDSILQVPAASTSVKRACADMCARTLWMAH